MSKKLIVSADDFGFSKGYNYGAVNAYREGIVTVLSLMSNMEAAIHGVELAKKEVPEANLVVHTNFVQGKPVSNPDLIPSLVDKNGEFYRSYKWKREEESDQKCLGDIVVTAEDCYKETAAQIKRFEELTGHLPNHFEGHSVINKNVCKGFQQAAAEFQIHCMTEPEVETDRWYPVHEIMTGNPMAMEILNRGCTPQDFIEDRFGILTSPFEFNIIHLHPGYVDAYILDHSSLTTARCRDLETACDPAVKQWLRDHDVELVDFTAVYK